MTGRDLPQDWLQAYADNALSPARRAAAEARLAVDPALAEALRALQAENAAIGAGVPEPEPARLATIAALAEARGRSRGPGLRAAALAGALIVGLGAGWFGAAQSYTARIDTLDAQSEQLALTAAAAHRLFAVEVLHPVEVTAAKRDHLNAWLSNRLGGAIHAPELAGTGFSLIGGRLLPGLGGAAAQFMYEDADGQRVTLFVVPGSGAPPEALRFEAEGDLTAVSWSDAHWRYALVGGIARDRLDALARKMHGDLI